MAVRLGPALMPWLHSAGSGRSYCCIKSHPHRKINIYVPKKCSSLSDVLSLLCQKKCLEPHGVLSISSKSFNILFFYGHRFHNLFFQRRVRVVRCHLSEFIDDIHALDNLSECGILSIQMRDVLCMMKNSKPAESGAIDLAMDRHAAACVLRHFLLPVHAEHL